MNTRMYAEAEAAAKPLIILLNHNEWRLSSSSRRPCARDGFGFADLLQVRGDTKLAEAAKLAMGASVADLAEASHAPVRAAITLAAGVGNASMWARAAKSTCLLPLAVRARVALAAKTPHSLVWATTAMSTL